MVSHDLVVEQHHDAFGMRAHQHHTARVSRIDAVTIMVGQRSGRSRYTHRLLDEAVEQAARLHQARPLILEYVPDRPGP